MSGVSIIGNTIKNQTLHGINVSIELESKSENISITGNTVQDFSNNGIFFRTVQDVNVTGNTLITNNSLSQRIYFIYLDAGPSPTRGIIASNWLRSDRPVIANTTTPIPSKVSVTLEPVTFVTYGIWTNETKKEGILLGVNGFSGNGWTKQQEGF